MSPWVKALPAGSGDSLPHGGFWMIMAHGSSPQRPYHVVWIPKYRRRILRGAIKIFVQEQLPQIQYFHPAVEVQQGSVQIDHNRDGDPSEICGLEYCGQDESQFESTTATSLSRTEANVLGSRVVVSGISLFDRGVE